MEACNRTESNNFKWLFALGAAVGTFLLVFVPGSWWLNGAKTPEEILAAVFLKQLLTIMLLLIVPSLWARLAHITSPWALLLLTGLAYGVGLLLSGNPLDALYAVLPAVLSGAGLYLLERLKLTNFRTVLYESFFILAGLFGVACLKDLIASGDAYRSVKEILGLYEQMLSGYQMEFAALGSAQLLDAVLETVELFRVSAETIAVPALLTAAMMAGLSNTLFSHLWNRRGGAALTALPKFGDWRCERWYVILVAVGSLVTILLRMFGVQSADGLSAVADVLWRMPCALAGLCALKKFGEQPHRGWLFWFAVVMLLMMPPVALLLLTVVGMLASLRRKSNDGEDGVRK